MFDPQHDPEFGESPADTELTESYLRAHGAAWDDPEQTDTDAADES